MGFRGREIAYSDDDFVVILLGDSEVYAAASPFEQIPERRLEHFLQKVRRNVKVFTLADMGYGQDQEYLALKKYFEKYRADLVLLMFTARNDIENNIFPTAGRNSTIKPTFWLKDNELHGPSEGWLESIGPPLKLALLWDIYFKKPYGESRNMMWEEKILPPGFSPLSDDHAHYLSQQKMESIKHKGTQNTANEISFGGMLYLNDERSQYGIGLTRKLFFEIKKLVEVNNGHFVIFKEERPEELQNLNSEQIYSDNAKHYDEPMNQYQDNLKKLFRDFEHYRIPLNLDNYTRSSDNIHLNEKAINKLMKDLSLILITNNDFK